MNKLGPYELNTVILGDCLEKMEPIPDNSIDSIVTDPPYGLGDTPDIVDLLSHWIKDQDYDMGAGFMNAHWDIVPGPAVWRECYRVLKPGGCLMAFGGTRTCDLLSIAIRLAGFQRFDQIVWLTGQGFAKGADISKKLDQLAGAEREVIGYRSPFPPDHPRPNKDIKKWTEARKRASANSNGNWGFDPTHTKDGGVPITAPATEAAALWSGWRSQLKPAHEVILCFWKPRESTFAKNALKWGVSGLWIDGCRIATDKEDAEAMERCNSPRSGRMYASKGQIGTFERSNGSGPLDTTQGRFPSNCLISHDPRCVRVGVKQVRGTNKPGKPGRKDGANGWALVNGGGLQRQDYADPDGLESAPDYRCHPDCPVWQLDRQAGVRKSGAFPKKANRTPNNSMSGDNYPRSRPQRDETGEGSASRFYYTPKAPPREKWFLCEICDDVYPYAERDNHAHGKPKGQRKHQIAHPTVKPLAINNYLFGVLEYLCRLTKTPTGGIVLDPFGGSGTTALAAIANGRDFLIIENDPIYHRIAEKRIEQAMKEPRQLELL